MIIDQTHYVWKLPPSWFLVSSSHGNAFGIGALFRMESIGHRRISHRNNQQFATMMFFFISINKLLNKQSLCRLFETPWRSRDVPIVELGVVSYSQFSTFHLYMCVNWSSIFPKIATEPPNVFLIYGFAHVPCMTISAETITKGVISTSYLSWTHWYLSFSWRLRWRPAERSSVF